MNSILVSPKLGLGLVLTLQDYISPTQAASVGPTTTRFQQPANIPNVLSTSVFLFGCCQPQSSYLPFVCVASYERSDVILEIHYGPF